MCIINIFVLDVKFNCGVIPKLFDQAEVKDMIQTFRRFPTVEYEGAGNAIYGVDQRHLAYLWFRRLCFKRIQQQFGDDVRLIFGMLLDCREPFGIHHDLKLLPDPGGKHYMSCLIPYSVDNDVALCSQAATVVFNEILSDFEQMPCVEHSAAHRHQDLAHVPQQQLEKVSVREWITWSPGDLIWWDSHLAHVSNDFRTLGHVSKQAIVIHTYVV
jgi:hypothetical protein